MKEYENSLKAYPDVMNYRDALLEKGRIKGRAKIQAKAQYEDYTEAYIEAYIEAYAEGYAEGIEQRNIEIAKKMLAAAIDIATIAQMTDLSEEDIVHLKHC